ncbi:uncharacterized protein LOC122682220 isoform X2 [Cervus elaphus]|uniref:uncharacterized protein LOC122682220 isoform X2 n=1 Tax=Cervus elaphus TaxID=9860 RepID=UPI001CC2E84A|nr:uncharacterized protein LOC122682220 isoform X2 [Cervus elaphus]
MKPKGASFRPGWIQALREQQVEAICQLSVWLSSALAAPGASSMESPLENSVGGHQASNPRCRGASASRGPPKSQDSCYLATLGIALPQLSPGGSYQPHLGLTAILEPRDGVSPWTHWSERGMVPKGKAGAAATRRRATSSSSCAPHTEHTAGATVCFGLRSAQSSSFPRLMGALPRRTTRQVSPLYSSSRDAGWDGLAFFPSGLWAAGPVSVPLWSPMDSGSPSTILLISFSLSPSITLGPASKSWPGSHATRDASPPWAIVLLSSAPAPTPLKAPHG